MTWTQRLKLLCGILAVLAVTAVLVLVFNQRQAQALSTTGQVVSAQASVGAAYGGVVTGVDADEGDDVTKGQPLFTVYSPDLRRDLSQGLEVASTEAFTVDTEASTVTYKALNDGRLSDVGAHVGGFVQSGANLAMIVSDGSQHAVADFTLSPRDYERIVKGARVSLRLPDDSTVDGTVGAVAVRTENGLARTRVTVESDALRDPSLAELAQPGTPVAATLSLRDDGPLAGPTDGLRAFLVKIGLS
jgi:multidrug resistance efflux pump